MGLAFNGDTYMLEEFRKLVRDFRIETICETGTYRGESTVALSALAPHVYTIEVDKERWHESDHLNDFRNVTRLRGNSAEVLNAIIPTIAHPVLFFLDAHWFEYNPLLAEMDAIAKHKRGTVVTVIHDIQVPNRPKFGFDTYDIPDGNGGTKRQPYCWDWIKPSIESIYGVDGYRHYFNDKANGEQLRGCCYVVPKS